MPPSCGCQVLSELVTTRHLKLTNTTEIPHYFWLLVSKPFSISQDGASRSHRALGWKQEGEEIAARGKQLVLHPQENMLVSGSICGPRLGGAHTPGLGVTFLSRSRACMYRQHGHRVPSQGCTQTQTSVVSRPRHALRTQGPTPQTDRQDSIQRTRAHTPTPTVPHTHRA